MGEVEARVEGSVGSGGSGGGGGGVCGCGGVVEAAPLSVLLQHGDQRVLLLQDTQHFRQNGSLAVNVLAGFLVLCNARLG